jgi:integrase
MVLKEMGGFRIWMRGFPSGQRGGAQDPIAKAFEGSNPSPRTLASSLYIEPKDDVLTSKLSFDEYLRNKELAESTIKTKVKLIRFFEKRLNLWDSDSVKQFIHQYTWGGKRKNNASYAYRDWCNWKGFDYIYKKYKEPESPLPYIPTETEIDQIIAECNAEYACLLQLLKETAFRIGEAMRLTPSDIDITRKIVTLNVPEKGSRARQAKMSDRLNAMIIPLIQKTGYNDRIWSLQYESLQRTFSGRRKVLADKLKNPNILKITFKTFRHWKATMEYHKTKDILHVKRLLGHRSIKNTLIYTHLVDFGEEDNFTVKVASSIEEFTALLEAGFEYVSDYGENKICRKRK